MGIPEGSTHAAATWKQNKAEFKCKMQMKEAKQTLTRIKKADKAEKKVLKQQTKLAKLKSRKSSPSPPRDTTDSKNPAAPGNPLQVLAEMGFDNIELNCQLLEAKNNDLQEVLKVPLG